MEAGIVTRRHALVTEWLRRGEQLCQGDGALPPPLRGRTGEMSGPDR
jgi:hypothetical protein